MYFVTLLSFFDVALISHSEEKVLRFIKTRVLEDRIVSKEWCESPSPCLFQGWDFKDFLLFSAVSIREDE